MSSPTDPQRPREGWRELWAAIRDAFLFTRGRLEIDPKRDFNRLQRFIATNLRVIFLVFRLEIYQRVELHAQALTMKTLLSLVPLIVVIFAVLSAFGGGLANANQDLIEAAIGYLSASEELQRTISEYLNTSSIREAKLGAFTIIVLVVTVMSLLSHVEHSFNTLFGVTARRPLGVRLLSYWALLTLGPLLMLTSIALTATLQSSVGEQIDALGGLGALAISAAPLVVSWFAFAVLYLTVPNTRVNFIPAVLASLVAGSLWNVAKYGFAFYARNNVTVQDIYGSLAALPLFIIWVYVSWVLILGGAQLCFAFQHASTYQPQRAGQEITFSALERAVCRLFFEIARDFQVGAKATLVGTVAQGLGIPGYLNERAVEVLREGGFIVDTAGGGLVPTRDLDHITVHDLLECIHHGTGEEPRLHQDDAGRYFEDLFDRLHDEKKRISAESSFRELVARFTHEPIDEPPRIGLAKDS